MNVHRVPPACARPSRSATGPVALLWCLSMLLACAGSQPQGPAATKAPVSLAKVAEAPAPRANIGRLPQGIRPAEGQAFFEMETILGDRFVFKLEDEGRIRQARDILARQLPKRVIGRIVPAAQAYNRPWHFHLDPHTIEFAYLTDESCDAAIHYVEDHLSEIGERLLPQNRWCPLSSRLVRELFPAN